jgi:hypothetical protein
LLLKDKITQCINEQRFSDILLLEKRQSRLIRPLFGLLYSEDHKLRIGAAYTIGFIAQKIYAKVPDKINQLLHKLLWSLNDESGFVCWGAPETIGEVVRNIPELKHVYAQFLISFLSHPQVALNNDFLEKGALIALARIRDIDHHLKEQLEPILEKYLLGTREEMSELSLWCGLEAGIDNLKNKAKDYIVENKKITVYIDGIMVQKPISDFNSA